MFIWVIAFVELFYYFICLCESKNSLGKKKISKCKSIFERYTHLFYTRYINQNTQRNFIMQQSNQIKHNFSCIAILSTSVQYLIWELIRSTVLYHIAFNFQFKNRIQSLSYSKLQWHIWDCRIFLLEPYCKNIEGYWSFPVNRGSMLVFQLWGAILVLACHLTIFPAQPHSSDHLKLTSDTSGNAQTSTQELAPLQPQPPALTH